MAEYLGFSLYSTMSSENGDDFNSLFPTWMSFVLSFFFFCLVAAILWRFLYMELVDIFLLLLRFSLYL